MDNNTLYEKAMSLVKANGLVEKYSQYKEDLMNNDFIVAHLEIDEILPETPIHSGFVDESMIEVSATNLVAFNLALGVYPVVYEGENDGRLLRNVCPRKSASKQISSHGSEFDFFPHVDNPDLPITGEVGSIKIGRCPDTLSLLSLKHQENVFTSILRLDDVLKNFSAHEIEILTKPNFIVKRPDSFESDDIAIKNLPLLCKVDGKFYSRFDYHNVDSHDEKSLEVLNKFREITLNEALWTKLCLTPGQVVIFNNQRTLHTRNKFTPNFDGNDRWLLRLFGVFNKPDNSALVSDSCNHHIKTI